MKIQAKFFLYHLLFLFSLISQDTYVSISFFGDDPLLYYISLSLIFTTIVCYSGVVAGPTFISANEENDSPFYCNSCQMRVPVRAFHCDKCHHCILRQTYHSEWADACIGQDNYMNYVFFILSEFLTLFFLIAISIISFLQIKNDQPLITLILNHILLLFLMPFWLYYFIQVIIVLLQNLYIITTSGNVLETRKFCGLTYLYIQPQSHNPFFSYSIDQNFSEIFSPVHKKLYVIKDPSKLSLYNEDIQNYKGIEYIQDPQ